MPGAETFRTSAADAYDRHVGRYGATLAAALIAFAGVEPGARALDVGCGPGALTTALAQLLGPANVCAADPSEPFAAACGSRLPGVEVVVAAAESLPFPDDVFDAALSQLVVNFLTDAVAGVREMARVTRPGGVVAACVWDYAGEMTLLRAFWDAAREIDPEGAAAVDEGSTMSWCSEGELAGPGATRGCARCAPASSSHARPTPTSTSSGHRSRPGSRPPARTASRSTPTAAPRSARPTAAGSA